jgi:hypothetical protein
MVEVSGNGIVTVVAVATVVVEMGMTLVVAGIKEDSLRKCAPTTPQD